MTPQRPIPFFDKPVRIATRGSTLALWQARHVAKLLQSAGAATELNVIKTTGDTIQDRFLHEIGGKGLFVKELEEALLQDRADIAVHSLKDLPVKLPKDYTLAAILPRHSFADVLILKSGHELLHGEGDLTAVDFRRGPLTIATSSLRRKSLLVPAGVTCVPVRGNVDTRIKKLQEQSWDGLILAEASLDRLELKVPRRRLEPAWFVPCAGQGALAIETLVGSPLQKLVQPFSCPETTFCVEVERTVLAALGGDCTMPFGCLVTGEKTDTKGPDTWLGRVVVADLNGRQARGEVRLHKSIREVGQLAHPMLDALKKAGVNEVLASLGLNHRL